jgi:hypothetical protein
MNSQLSEDILLETGLRRQVNIFLEPLLIKACELEANEIGCRTRSKFIRYSIINNLLLLKYPLIEVSEKYKPYLNNINQLLK